MKPLAPATVRNRRVLIVGTGSIGERHLRCFLATGVEAGIVEPNASLRSEVAQEYGVAHAFESLEEAFADRSGWRADAVVICTPANMHVAMARAAVAAGCHVLIEKPLSTNCDEVSDLLREAADADRVVGLAYVYRAHPASAAAREAVQSGRFGDPVEVVAVSGQNFPHYRPAYRDIYYKSRATGGGAVQDALTHVINAVEWIVGPARRVVADATHQVLDGVGVEDTAHVLARHGDIDREVLVSFALNQYQAPNENTITVVCREGVVRIEMHAMRWQWCVEPGAPWHDEPVASMARDELFVRQAEAFLESVERISLPLCSLAEGVQTLKSTLAILRSAEAGRWEEVEA